MRHCRMQTVALAALIAWCVPAQAADDKAKPIPEEGAIEIVLLRHKAVRDDLKLTHQEARKIHEFTEEQWKKAEQIEELPDAKERDRKYEEMTREDEKFLDEILTVAQHKRLDQITLQVAALLWIKRPEIAAAAQTDRRTKEKGRPISAGGPEGDGGAPVFDEGTQPSRRATQAERALQAEVP